MKKRWIGAGILAVATSAPTCNAILGIRELPSDGTTTTTTATTTTTTMATTTTTAMTTTTTTTATCALPAQFDALEWFDPGFFDMTQGALVGVKDDRAFVFVWDPDPALSHTIEVLTLAELWARGSTDGGPPDSGIEAMAVTPPGPATAEYAGNVLLVSSDGGVWSFQWDGGQQAWGASSLAAYNWLPPVPSVESATIFRIDDIQDLHDQLMLIAHDDLVYWNKPSGTVWTNPLPFCTSGSEAFCPTGATTMARIPPDPDAGSSGGARILVQHDGTTYVASILWNTGTNAPEFSAWTPWPTDKIPCPCGP